MAVNSSKERFFKYVQPQPNGCWLWLGGKFQNGYGSFGITTERGTRSHYAHRVAWAFENGPVPAGLDVCHTCDVRNCVNADHLFLGTRKDNMQDAVRKGRHAHGERQGRSKLTEAQVREILCAEGTQEEIAARYGVSRGAVSAIRTGKHWTHAATDVARQKPREHVIKLNPELARQIRVAEGTHNLIASKFGVTRATVSLVRSNRIWKE